MTIKEAFEYLSSECGIGMKNPFIALRNLVEAFGKVADEIDPTPSGDFVKKSGDTMTGPLTVEDEVIAQEVTTQEVTAAVFKFEEPILGGSISLTGVPGLEQVGIQIPNKSGTMVLSSTVENYTTAEHVVGRWIDGKPLYQITLNITPTSSSSLLSYDVSSLSIDNCIDIRGYSIRNTNGNKIVYYTPTIESDNYMFWVRFDASSKSIRYKSYYSDSNCDAIVITLQYTKTT